MVAGTTDNDSNSTFLLREQHYLLINSVVLDFVVGRNVRSQIPHTVTSSAESCTGVLIYRRTQAFYAKKLPAVLNATVKEIVCTVKL
jgi:hypothetical protein